MLRRVKYRPLFHASLGLNIVLAGAWLFASRVMDFSKVSVGTPESESTGVASQHKPGAGSLAFAHDPRRAEAWALIFSDNPDRFTTNLRAAGVSEDHIRWLVSGLVYHKVDKAKVSARAKALKPYWSTRPEGEDEDSQDENKLLAAASEDLKRLLGSEDPVTEEVQLQGLRSEYGNLAPDKIRSISRIIDDYGELRSKVMEGSGGIMFPEDTKKLELLEKEQKHDILALLSDTEREEYELRSSDTANRLRSTIQGVSVSEAEYRRLFQLQKEFDAAWNGEDPSAQAANSAAQREAAEKQLQAEFKQVMGGQRYEDYERANDYSFKIAQQIVDRLQLPKENALAVYQLRKSVEQQLKDLQNAQTLPPEARNLAARQLEATAKASLSQYLGSTGAVVYKDNGGYWLNELEQYVADTTSTTDSPDKG